MKLRVTMDGETTKVPRHLPFIDGSFMVQFGVKVNGEHRSFLFNHPEATQSIRQNLIELQEIIDEADTLIAHNLKFELLWLKHLGIKYFHKTMYCTQVGQYLIEGQLKGPKGYYKLDTIAERRGIAGKTDQVKALWDAGYDTHEIPASTLIPYNQQDNNVAEGLFLLQMEDIRRNPRLINIVKMQMNSIKLLTEIEYNGMLISRKTLNELNDEYTKKVADYDKELEDCAGFAINWQSKPQVSALLFGGAYEVEEVEEYTYHYKDPKKPPVQKTRKIKREIVLEGMGFKPNPRSETKLSKEKNSEYKTYCVDANTILSLRGSTPAQRRFLKVYGLRAKAEKLRSTYFEGLQTKLIGDYLHPTINQTIARNGRLSCSNPNLQNQPRGTTGPVKEIFVSRFQ